MMASSQMTAPSELPASEYTSFEELRILTAFQVIALALFVYDYLLTFSEEVNLVWLKKLNPSIVVFYLVRYLPFIDGPLLVAQEFIVNPSPSTCMILYQVRIASYCLGLLLADCILVLRTYAIWEKNVVVLGGLGILVLGTSIGSWYTSALFVQRLSFTPSPSPSRFPGCFVPAFSDVLWIAYLMVLILETAIFIVTLYGVIARGRYGNSPLLRAVYRDGITFYAYLFAISVVNIVVLRATPSAISTSLIALHRNLHSILAYRLLMRIRVAANPAGSNQLQDSRTQGTLEPISFVELRPM